MKRIISTLLILITLSSSLGIFALQSGVAVTTENGGTLSGILDKGVTYVSAADYCAVMADCAVSFDPSTRTMTAESDMITLTVAIGNPYFEANGRYFYLANPARIVNGRVMMPLRSISEPFCMDVSWDGQTKTAALAKNGKILIPGSRFYDETELYWLSRIISAESKGEIFEGQIAVGNVILNRVKNSEFPDSVYSVIFDRNYGIQFTPVANGTIHKAPSTMSVIAAKICLEGQQILPGVMYFLNRRTATNTWIPKNRPYSADIGLHSFYR